MTQKRHPFHSMCSYLGCFPPDVPRALIEEWVPEGRLILDPFCGAGTTLIEGLSLGHPCIGIDLNPLAVALAQAKMQAVSLEDVLLRINDLARQYPGGSDTGEVTESLRTIYHPRTLAQLVYLRSTLDAAHPEDLFIRGTLLGIMHGKAKKSGATSYLSIDMPNTFSMSPEYVKRFVETHRLKQPPVDVFSKLRERAAWLLRSGPLQGPQTRMVFQGDATSAAEILKKAGLNSVDAIVTSPPYLGVLRYGAFNWIRLWLLGSDPSSVDRSLDVTDSLDRYLSFLASFLLSSANVLPPGSPMILVIGDVVENGNHLALAERVWEELAEVVPYSLVSLDEDRFNQDSKTTRIWGEGRKGKATPLDRRLILERNESRKRTRLDSTATNWQKNKTLA